MGYILEMRNWIIGYVKDAELGVCLKARDLGESIVGDVECFEVREGRETGNRGEAIGLDGEKSQRREVRDVLQGVSISYARLVVTSLIAFRPLFL